MSESGTVSRVIREKTYSINPKTNEVVIANVKANPLPNLSEEQIYFVTDVIENDFFAKFYEIALKLKCNEEKVGVTTLKTRYKTSYEALLKELYTTLSAYIEDIIFYTKRRNGKVYLKEYFESEEFNTSLLELKKEINKVLKSREFERIPFIVYSNKINDEIDAKDVAFGNFEIVCEENDKKVITNIKWCQTNCSKYPSCPIYKLMEKENPFNYKLNMEFLEEQ